VLQRIVSISSFLREAVPKTLPNNFFTIWITCFHHMPHQTAAGGLYFDQILKMEASWVIWSNWRISRGLLYWQSWSHCHYRLLWVNHVLLQTISAPTWNHLVERLVNNFMCTTQYTAQVNSKLHNFLHLKSVHFVGLRYWIVSQCFVQNTNSLPSYIRSM